MRILRSATGHISRSRLLVLIGAAIVLVTGASSSLTAQPSTGQYRLVAVFTDASPLVVGNDVKVDGVSAGHVDGMTVRNGQAAVALSLDPAALPIHVDARATIKPVSLLGERYIDLDRGSPNAPLLSPGGELPVRQTGQSTDLDQVLNTVDDPTGQSLAALITMLGEGVQGNGANIDGTIKALGPAMGNTNQLVDVLKQQNGVLNSLIDNVEPVSAALAADNGKTVDSLVDSAHQLLGTTTENQAAIQNALAELPSTMTQARNTLAQLTGTAQATTPTLRSIRPTTDNLSAISAELNQFADSANPALASTPQVLHAADRLLEQARPVAQDLRKAGPTVPGLAGGLKPVVNDFTNHLPSFWNFIQGWALTTNGYDGLSHYFRAMVTLNTDQLTNVLPPLAGVANGNPNPARPAPGPVPLPLPTPPGLTGPGAPLGGLLPPGNSPDGGVTGLNQQQEGGALTFLLGGQ